MPYISNTKIDIDQMLKALGISSIEELYGQIPKKLRLKDNLDIGKGLSELEVRQTVEGLSNKNRAIDSFNSFLGAGFYDHYIPAALDALVSAPQFVTAYTPYQAECSQGILQAIYEYQSYICNLTGMDVSNASLLDGASSLAEAVLMSLRLNRRSKVLVSSHINPQYRQTLNTYLSGFDYIVSSIKAGKQGLIDVVDLELNLDSDVSCLVIQSPNFFGLIEEVSEVSKLLKDKGILLIMVTNPLSLAVFKAPGDLGVDIVCGDGQSLGQSLNLGGPSFGFLAAKQAYTRQIPGRIVGKTTDCQGNQAFCLTLATREQHIRREKATSNICSNQSLNVIGATIYLSLMGSRGLKATAEKCFNSTQYLYHRLKEVRGVNIIYPNNVFNEFIWQVDKAKYVFGQLYKKNIIPGFLLADLWPGFENGILSCCTEKKTKNDIDMLVNNLAEVLRGQL